MTEGKSCPSCGAQNEPAAQFCWQCYGRFWAGVPAAVGTAVAAAPAPVGAPAAAASHGLPVAPPGPIHGPPPVPPWQQSGGYASTTPEPVQQGGAWKGRIMNLALLAIVAAGAFLGWRTFFRDPFPQAIGGLHRIDIPAAGMFEDAVKETGKSLGLKMRGAVYGRGSEIELMAILSQRAEATMGLDAAFLEPLPLTDPRLPGTRVEEFQQDGATFRCFSFQAEMSGTGCFWLDAETTGFVFTNRAAVPQGMELTAAVRRAVA